MDINCSFFLIDVSQKPVHCKSLIYKINAKEGPLLWCHFQNQSFISCIDIAKDFKKCSSQACFSGCVRTHKKIDFFVAKTLTPIQMFIANYWLDQLFGISKIDAKIIKSINPF